MQRCATQLPLSLSRLHEPTGSMCEVSERMYTTYRKTCRKEVPPAPMVFIKIFTGTLIHSLIKMIEKSLSRNKIWVRGGG
ncbi:hypothetical protein EJB05_13266 [Eragrostis curvula]|uniref:Uncharacterized protein n=1 Tax=Eragrostis curvula TaxID=38414 RepID=A0A5J9VW11_9POAL|nr:hypothetical protein EJB05_56606 [Eragrostis curvula]TVU39826.1 hypothetical protein EJB05_13266 [Eragrostis curvula]